MADKYTKVMLPIKLPDTVRKAEFDVLSGDSLRVIVTYDDDTTTTSYASIPTMDIATATAIGSFAFAFDES